MATHVIICDQSKRNYQMTTDRLLARAFLLSDRITVSLPFPALLQEIWRRQHDYLRLVSYRAEMLSARPVCYMFGGPIFFLCCCLM